MKKHDHFAHLRLLLAFFLGFDGSLTFALGIDLCREWAEIVSKDEDVKSLGELTLQIAGQSDT